MTILAGIISRVPKGECIPERTRTALRRLMSRDPSDVVVELGGADWLMAKVDIRAFEAEAVYEDERATSMLAGEPLLAADGQSAGASRADDLKVLHGAVAASVWATFAQTSGTFCGVHYDRSARTLTLIADKVGLRPIYYWSNERFVIYASALRILEGLAEIPKLMDLRGVAEIACFGFPLADRTAYQGVKTIGAGEIVRFSGQAFESLQYWRWDRLAPPSLTGVELAQEVQRRFVSAVERRARGSRSEVAFLSGGLDSRTIVASLRGLGAEVQSINFAPRDSQDEVFARQAAEALGTTHYYLAKDAEVIGDKKQTYNQGAVGAWFASRSSDKGEFHYPRRRIWSGDGGSVGVGHVYLNANTVELARGGRLDDAIDEFCRHNNLVLSPKLFRTEVSELVSSIPKQGIREELTRIECVDRGRAFHLFLLLNDQRRHLADFYENVDLGRFEFQLPFFDARFLEPILASPVEDFLGHRFYMRFLKNFPPKVLSVPWQAYPGHEQCPLPIPKGLAYQWLDYYDQDTRRRVMSSLIEQAYWLLKTPRHLNPMVDRLRFRIITILTRFGLQDYSYLIRTAAIFSRYWRLCEGEASKTGPAEETHDRVI